MLAILPQPQDTIKYLTAITTSQIATLSLPQNWFQILVNASVSIATVYIYTHFQNKRK
jgi:hypothetical protein